MNNYLSLIPISARVNRRQNRMTLLCIMISVFLVTAMFGVADMFIRSNSAAMQEKHGNWHIHNVLYYEQYFHQHGFPDKTVWRYEGRRHGRGRAYAVFWNGVAYAVGNTVCGRRVCHGLRCRRDLCAGKKDSEYGDYRHD